jgi:hypothetical protein
MRDTTARFEIAELSGAATDRVGNHFGGGWAETSESPTVLSASSYRPGRQSRRRAGAHALVAEVTANDKATILDAGNRADPSVSINGSGLYVVTYTSNDNGDLNIRRRIGHL